MKSHCPKKYTLEYIFIASVKLLYHYLSTEQGLSEWFADKVELKDDVFHFYWGDTEQKATLSAKKENESIRFKWLDEEFDNYFEFKIDTNSIMSENTLVITDFAFEENMKEAEMLWNSAINKMLRIIGGKLVHSPS
ncbi:MAG: START-like domain-containing protein [Bacteroidales bacterium]|jgi:uncharacterized protein YndB with AHSA1/START domain